MATIAVDWDDVLVNVHTQQWLPGAVDALRQLSGRADVTIFSCRTTWKGSTEIRQRLDGEGLRRVKIHEEPGKPRAMLYIDDKALRFTDWTDTLPAAKRLLHEHNVAR